MEVFQTVDDLRQARWENPTKIWGLVPTMGFLHAGHLRLVEQACEQNDRVGVSIFVNPAQFNNPNDLEKYPRNLEQDLDMLKQAGVDLVWTPTPQMVYPASYQTYVDVEQITQKLEGATRPGHFRGVATVVSKLFNVFQPTRAYFGQKDAQQLAVIKQMVEDLNFNLEIVACPTVRESDGLAMSSRNANLSPTARQNAICLYKALTAAKDALLSGQQSAEMLRHIMTEIIESTAMTQIDYVSVAHPQTFSELEKVESQALLSMAIFVDGVRLIDNILID
ncbi:MAG: pantoate--beta-alanine ligase [SAR324 cluster bacterium]|nr:pantoate--beta-alanine ligase [SAR324 cluster bacterium]